MSSAPGLVRFASSAGALRSHIELESRLAAFTVERPRMIFSSAYATTWACCRR